MSYPKLPAEFKEKWVAALRSGEYKQGAGRLHDNINNLDCCLNVACKVAGEDSDSEHYISGTKRVPDILVGIPQENNLVGEISDMNDSGVPFPEIADWIEENL